MNINLSKPIKTFISFFILGLVAIVAYALGSGLFHASFSGNPNYTYQYEIELENATIASTDLLPGESVSITPKITSKSTGNSYVFMRIHCGTVDNKLIYDFEDEDQQWTVVKRDVNDGYLLVVYGSESACSPFAPGAEINVNGKLTLNLDYAEYATLAGTNDPLGFQIHVCGIHSEDVAALNLVAPDPNPLAAYEQYLEEGGE